MTHPLVTQLHFARSELQRCLSGLSDEDARRHLAPINPISWMIGHLANQENVYWVLFAQGQSIHLELQALVQDGKPVAPPLADIWQIWESVTQAADVYLNQLTDDQLGTHLEWRGEKRQEDVGTHLLRNTFHYWFHIGEAHAVRQQLGHNPLPQFVGSMGGVRYR